MMGIWNLDGRLLSAPDYAQLGVSNPKQSLAAGKTSFAFGANVDVAKCAAGGLVAFKGWITNAEDYAVKAGVQPTCGMLDLLARRVSQVGAKALTEMEGDWSAALWSPQDRRLVLARDHMGVSRLFYWQDGPRLVFAQSVSEILNMPGVP